MVEEEKFKKIQQEKEKKDYQEKVKKSLEKRDNHKNYSGPVKEYIQKDPYRDPDNKGKK